MTSYAPVCIHVNRRSSGRERSAKRRRTRSPPTRPRTRFIRRTSLSCKRRMHTTTIHARARIDIDSAVRIVRRGFGNTWSRRRLREPHDKSGDVARSACRWCLFRGRRRRYDSLATSKTQLPLARLLHNHRPRRFRLHSSMPRDTRSMARVPVQINDPKRRAARAPTCKTDLPCQALRSNSKRLERLVRCRFLP